MHNQKLGRWGEDLALKYLQNKKFKILARNFYCKWGEIDLIATKNSRLHFFEVKTRSNLNKGRPEEALTWRKRKSFFRTACVFCQRYHLAGTPWQLDVLAIIYDPVKNLAQVKYIPNISVDSRPGYSVR